MRMTFLLVMDRPVDREIHYIAPGGYCLRFYKPDNSSVDIQFDFIEYACYIDGQTVKCVVTELDDDVYPDSLKLESLLSSVSSGETKVSWVEFFVYTGEDMEPEINPVCAKNIIVYSGDSQFSLPDYTFTNQEFELPATSLDHLKSALPELQDVCKSLGLLRKGSTCRLFDVKGVVYLCFSDSVLFPAVSVARGFRVSVGSGCAVDSLARVWPPVRKAIHSLNRGLKVSIQSISIPYDPITKGIYKASLEEQGSFDIILK